MRSASETYLRVRCSERDECNDEIRVEDEFNGGSSSKGTRWMPRHRPAMKDVASCEKPGGVARER